MSGSAAAQTATTGYTRMFPGRPEQVARVRGEVVCYLQGHPAADDVVLVTSELAANAVLHSKSKGDFFTVNIEVHDTYVYIEVEDAGGHWVLRPPDAERPHGLDLVQALTGPDGWGVDGGMTGRVVWARVETGQ